MLNELVSIVMPVYNGASTISESIKSVLAQTYILWELIIVDDCSTDDTGKVVAEFNDARIHYCLLSQNNGVAMARNRGIDMAKGRYIAFLDSDDLWLPNKLECQLSIMKGKNYGFTYTEYRQFKDNPQCAGKLIKIHDYVDYQELLKGNDIGCLTVMIDRNIHPDIKMPNARHEDYIAWLNILKLGGRAYGIHEDLARYRKSSQSITSNKWLSFKWTWDVYRKYQKLSQSESMKMMCYYIIKGLLKHC